MKKIVSVLFTAFSLLVFKPSNAQQMTGTYTSGDTVISTGTKSFVVAPSLNYKTATFQVVATRLSAAQGGTWKIYGSNDGSNYMQLFENVHPYVTNDTVTIADAATNSTFTNIQPAEGLGFKYYKVTVTGASSDTMKVKAWFSGRQ